MMDQPNNVKDNNAAMLQEDVSFLMTYEPMNPDERVRNDADPVGLKNIGNSKIVV
jgi:hypothetical protein